MLYIAPRQQRIGLQFTIGEENNLQLVKKSIYEKYLHQRYLQFMKNIDTNHIWWQKGPTRICPHVTKKS